MDRGTGGAGPAAGSGHRKADHDLERQRGALDRRLGANPNIALAENNLGYIFERKGQLEEAFRHYQHALEIRPRYVEAHINLGNVYLRKG